MRRIKDEFICAAIARLFWFFLLTKSKKKQQKFSGNRSYFSVMCDRRYRHLKDVNKIFYTVYLPFSLAHWLRYETRKDTWLCIGNDERFIFIRSMIMPFWLKNYQAKMRVFDIIHFPSLRAHNTSHSQSKIDSLPVWDAFRDWLHSTFTYE